MFRIFLCFIVLFLVGCKKQPQHLLLKEIETIQAQTLKLSDSSQVKPLLEKGLNLAKNIRTDSTQINYKRKMIIQYYNHKMYDKYFDLTKENLEAALKLNDSNYISKLYLDVGDYYQSTYQIDSAYFYYRKALPYFTKINKHQISTNYEIARLLSKENLHMESEVILYQNLQNAIDYGDDEMISSFYNSIANNYNNTSQFDLAIEAFKKSEFYINQVKIEQRPHTNSILKTQCYTNLGWTYTRKKDFVNAKKYFDLALKEVEINNDPIKKTYLLINNQKLNHAQSKPINQKSCEEVLKLATENNVQDNVVNAKHYLGIAAFQKNDVQTAFKHINEGIALAKRLRFNEILLEIYESLSFYDDENEKKWLKEIINLKDEMINEERQTRNKFAKITYETEVVHQKNKVLTKKIYQQFIYGGIAVFLLLLFIILYKTKTDNKILKLIQEQKDNNLTIFNLMVNQHDMLEKGKNMEKSRISKELHDGIASQLYLMKFVMGIHIEKEMPKNEVEKLFNDLGTLQNQVRKLSHDLSKMSITEHKLLHLIEELIEEYNKHKTFQIDLTHNENYEESNLSNDLKVNIYRIIQEALKNIHKYAQAKNVHINFELGDDNQLTLTITDDGKGFNVNRTKKGIGLKNMKERTEEFYGVFEVKSTPKKGTTIKSIISLNNPKKAD